MAIYVEDVLERANEIYAEAKLGDSTYYTAPELRPQIQSDQIKALAEALVEILNRELAED